MTDSQLASTEFILSEVEGLGERGSLKFDFLDTPSRFPDEKQRIEPEMRDRIEHSPAARRMVSAVGRRIAASALAFWMTGIPVLRAGDGIQSAGDALRLILPATAAGTALLRRDTPGAVQFVESAALTGVVTEALKVIVDERRPNGNRYSFPSGHTSISFCSAEFLRKRYGWRYGAPAYAASAFVGFSRVQARKHWIHDVAAGAAIGAAFSAWRTRSGVACRVEAFSGNGCAGIRLRWAG